MRLFAELCQQQQGAGKPLFAGIEELVHQVFLHAGVTGQQIRYENLRKLLILMTTLYAHPFKVDGSMLSTLESDGQQRAVNAKLAVVFDESQLAKPIHEEIDP